MCVICPAGTYADNEGLTTCIKCWPGSSVMEEAGTCFVVQPARMETLRDLRVSTAQQERTLLLKGGNHATHA